jgi:N6-L-threonylcarbamoyladenine synthase
VVSEHGEILAQALASQIEIHRAYGGVVPEVASRTHFEVVDNLTAQVLSDPALKISTSKPSRPRLDRV